MSEFDPREFCERLAVVMKEAGFINPPRVVEGNKKKNDVFIPLELDDIIPDFQFDDLDVSSWFE